jgi:hypothetical protein
LRTFFLIFTMQFLRAIPVVISKRDSGNSS